MIDEDTFDKLRRVVARTFDVDPATLSRSTTADDVDGWDSLAHSTLLIRIRKAFDVGLDQDRANAAQSLGSLADLLHGTLAGRGRAGPPDRPAGRVS